jgi:HPt (histidine-containing phosphotransfer) domain-containing protein
LSTPYAYRCSQPWLLLQSVDNERDIFIDLAQVFRHETLARYDDIARHAAAGAWRDMAMDAHSLKGTVGIVGAAELMALLVDIEQGGIKRAMPCSAEQLARLADLLAQVRDDMDDFLRTL